MNKRLKWLERGAETEVHIFPIVLHLIGAYRIKNISKVPLGTFLMFFRGNTVQYLIKPGTFKKSGQVLLEMLKKDQALIENITKSLERKLDELINFSTKVFKSDLKKCSNSELIGYYEKFNELVIEMMESGSVGPILEWEESLLTDELTKYLTRQFRKIKDEKSVGEALADLTTPLRTSWIALEQLSLYQIAADIEDDQLLRRDIIECKSISKLIDDYPEFIVSLNRHQEDYHWIYYNYEGPEKNSEYFLEILAEILKTTGKPSVKLQELKSQVDNITARQRAWADELQVDIDHQHLFHVAQELSYQKGIRRDLTFKAYWQISKLLTEIAMRTSLSLSQVRSIAPNEMRSILVDKIVDSDNLNARLKLCAVLVENEKFKYLAGPAAKELAEEVDRDLQIKVEQAELKGSTAYPGQAQGVVRIVQRKQDNVKVNQGDILVSSATNPELMPAIRRSVAIVTDEGGITCHAAIVARELKIPCVIGTKIATRLLKDGDRIIVDADSGVVRFINL